LLAGKNFSQGIKPNWRGAGASKSMKKSILILGAFIGIGLVAVSCQNPNEVFYETPSSAPATGPGGSQLKAKPSAFGPENNPGR